MNQLPVPDIFSDFESQWNTTYIGAHGTIGNKMIVIPPNTYILNLATAGYPCSVLKGEIANWIYDYESGGGAGGGGAGGGGVGGRKMKQKLWIALKNGTFLKEVGDEGIYKNIKNSSNITTRRTKYLYNNLSSFNRTKEFNKSQRTTSNSRSIAYYEPGDIIYNIYFNMYNGSVPFFLMGMYNFPIKFSHKRDVFQTNMKHKIFPENSDMNEINTRINKVSLSAGILDNEHSALFNNSDNLMKADMFNPDGTIREKMFTFEDIFSKLDTSKTNFIIVDVCRSLLKSMRSGPELQFKRRMSILTRKLIPNINATTKTPKPVSTLNIDFITEIKNKLDIMYTQNPRDSNLKDTIDFLEDMITTGTFRDSDLKNVLNEINRRYVPINSDFMNFLLMP